MIAMKVQVNVNVKQFKAYNLKIDNCPSENQGIMQNSILKHENVLVKKFYKCFMKPVRKVKVSVFHFRRAQFSIVNSCQG